MFAFKSCFFVVGGVDVAVVAVVAVVGSSLLLSLLLLLLLLLSFRFEKHVQK